MPKIKIKVSINEDTYERDAIKKDNSISYQEKDKTRVNYNYDSNVLIRDNNEFKMEYDFNNKNGKIILKEFSKTLEIIIKVNKLIKKDNYLEIEYEIENDKYNYRIEELK